MRFVPRCKCRSLELDSSKTDPGVLRERAWAYIESRFQTKGVAMEMNEVGTTHRYQEGKVATAIETQTAKLPSDTFLWAAGGSIAASLALKMAGRDRDALFVGQWAPTLLILGLYNKLVKMFGTDSRHDMR
jgi:hypothetical protein